MIFPWFSHGLEGIPPIWTADPGPWTSWTLQEQNRILRCVEASESRPAGGELSNRGGSQTDQETRL